MYNKKYSINQNVTKQTMINTFQNWQTPASYMRRIKNKREVYLGLAIALGISAMFYFAPVENLIIECAKFLGQFQTFLYIKGFHGISKNILGPITWNMFTHPMLIATAMIAIAATGNAVFNAWPQAKNKLTKLDNKTKKFFEKAFNKANSHEDISSLEKDLENKFLLKKASFKDYVIEIIVSSKDSFGFIVGVVTLLMNVSLLLTFMPAGLVSLYTSMTFLIPTIVTLVALWVAVKTAYLILNKDIEYDIAFTRKINKAIDKCRCTHEETAPIIEAEPIAAITDTAVAPANTVNEDRVGKRFMCLFEIYKNRKANPRDAETEFERYANDSIKAYRARQQKSTRGC